MDPELLEALAVIERVCASVNANLNDHRIIQGSLEKIKGALTPPAPAPVDDGDKTD